MLQAIQNPNFSGANMNLFTLLPELLSASNHLTTFNNSLLGLDKLNAVLTPSMYNSLAALKLPLPQAMPVAHPVAAVGTVNLGGSAAGGLPLTESEAWNESNQALDGGEGAEGLGVNINVNDSALKVSQDAAVRRRRKTKPLALPPGWRMVERTSQKCRYKTYVSPQGKSFRSLAQVARYLETQAHKDSVRSGEVTDLQKKPRIGSDQRSDHAALSKLARILRVDGSETEFNFGSLEGGPHRLTLLFTHPACLMHETGEGHLESPFRLLTVLQQLGSQNIPDFAWRMVPTQASLVDVSAVHNRDYVAGVLQLCDLVDKGVFERLTLDPPNNDTMIAAGTRHAALYAAGAVTAAVDAVMQGQARNAFCAVRPPGHHATSSKPSGFCIFNHVAIGVSYLQRAHHLRRIAIVDFDIHHGNGTQELLRDDANVLFVSVHRLNVFPFSGTPQDTGEHKNILNIPVESRKDFIRASNTIVEALDIFRPVFIFISAGFGGHLLDTHSLDLQEEDFDNMTEKILGVAQRICGGRLVSVLEGGYCPDVLAKCVVGHVRTLSTAHQTDLDMEDDEKLDGEEDEVDMDEDEQLPPSGKQ